MVSLSSSNKLSILIALILSAACFSSSAARPDTSRPNILFILTDQQNFFTLKAYGNDVVHAPGLNSLADESFVFENAYVTQPVCAPSRGSIMTGLYPHTHGVIDNNRPLDPGILTLPEMLGQDYQSAYIGKWHLGDEVFKQRGFDTWVSMEDGYQTEFSPQRDINARSDYHHWLIEKGYEPNKKGNRFSRRFAAGLPLEHCKPAFLQKSAIDFLNQVGDTPFIMYVSFLEPHKPYTGPLDSLYSLDEIILPENFTNELGENDPRRYKSKASKDISEYKNEEGYKALIARYWGLVSQVDLSVKAILDRLDQLNLDDNTIVVFTSDHGSMMGSHKIVSKDVMYEESARVPLILKSPQLAHGHQFIENRISLIDVVPTLLDLSGGEVPAHLPGTSLVPFLRGETSADRDVFLEWPDIRTIVTTDGWKMALIENDRSLLFDLNKDPLETNNLFYEEGNDQIIADLTEKIKSWQVKTQDNYSLELYKE
ncbi:MAG: sulfatase-like hydrolase/transferase [Bacteroidota bacterium]